MKKFLCFAISCFYSVFASEAFHDIHRNNLKNRFLAASALSQNLDSHSCLAMRQWSFAPNQDSEELPCRIPDSSSCFGTSGTNYGKEGAEAYAFNRHGPDGSILLDPYFVPYLENLEGKRMLDAGCGAAPWAIYAANHGAEVFGIDIQKGMIEQ